MSKVSVKELLNQQIESLHDTTFEMSKILDFIVAGRQVALHRECHALLLEQAEKRLSVLRSDLYALVDRLEEEVL